MTKEEIRNLLESVKAGTQDVNGALEVLRDLPFSDLGFAKIDNHRELRTGYPEVIFCQGKTVEQVTGIVQLMLQRKENILGTRVSEVQFEAVKVVAPDAVYHPLAHAFVIHQKEIQQTSSYIAVVTAGTADIPIAEEAALTAETFGNRVERVFDVGIAGIHRLYSKLDVIRGGKVIVAVAGMEGALPGVIGGLVSSPIIAVPTSVGYGANFNGLSALLTMLNSCAAGISVVNIDNGFGAGYMAGLINKL